ncbi:MAG TPA: DUF2786 domain-containing protein [Acetobacteraceae bacterium]|nr:DUF2786 domain-containing protein [Acetobacteraceae bacterium]
MNRASAAVRLGPAGDEVFARLPALNDAALAFVARDKAEHQARTWLSNVPWIVHDGHWGFARSLALELALITPSLSGSTAFDRLARGMSGPSANDLAASALLRRSQPRIARLTGSRFEDLATGETRTLLPSPFGGVTLTGMVFGRFAVTAEGSAIATGALLPLDQEALAVALGFVRPQVRGLTNPVRCAEAVYRYMVRRGAASAAWREPEPDLPFDPEHDPLDALAADWALLDRDPGPDEIAQVKVLIGVQPLLNALISVGIARDGGVPRLAEAYRRIAAAVIEFMAAREAYGSSRFSLDRAAAEVDAAVKHGRCGFATKALFNDLRERARLAVGRAPGASGDLDKLVQRIRGLREKTVEQGCTEQEAMAAAEKVAELLDRYGLSLSELDLRKQSCEGIGVETGRKRRGPIDDCMGTIAVFFDCRVWAETAESGALSYIFFGLPGDVQAAVYLHDLVALAFAAETATFQKGEFYRGLSAGDRRSATNSYQVGLAQGIINKLNAMRHARDAGRTNGRALVPVKQSIIEQEMERLGLTLRRLTATKRRVIPDAFNSGREAGERFEYRPGIAGA